MAIDTPTPVKEHGKPEPGKGKPGGGLSGAWKKNPAMVLGIGGAGVVVLYALAKRNSSASTANGNADTTTTGTGVPTYDSTANDVYNSIESQLSDLQSQIGLIGQNQTGTGNGTGTTSTPPTKPKSGPQTLPGPFHYESTRVGAQSLPEIEHLFGISQAQLLAYNPSWVGYRTSWFDPHNIAVGTTFRVPATAQQSTLHPKKK